MRFFISYGDDKYKESKIRIKKEAEGIGFFDKICIYEPENLTKDFVDATSPYINLPRGGGYWLWKPFFIKKTLDEMDYGDFCIYADGGCSLNYNQKNKLYEYEKICQTHPSGMLLFYLDDWFSESKYTNSKVLEFFSCDKNEDFLKSGQIIATYIIFVKNKKSENVINKWYDIAVNHADLFSDIHNDYKKRDDFIDHRHDQSILSCIIKNTENVHLQFDLWQQQEKQVIVGSRLRK